MNEQAERMIYCAYWDGMCLAAVTTDCKDASKQVARWIRQGATIQTLPTAAARQALCDGIDEQDRRKAHAKLKF